MASRTGSEAELTGDILVLNSGSSSLKAALYSAGDLEHALLTASASGIGAAGGGRWTLRDAGGRVLVEREHQSGDQSAALEVLAEAMRSEGHRPPPGAVGHRLVHGGTHLTQHTRITPEVMRQLSEAVHFAPLHIPSSLQLIHKAEALYPAARQYACFDTAFHQTMPEREWRLPIPDRWTDAGVRRYGFHGLSYESIVRQLRAERSLPERLVVAHLGSGASVCAIRDGRSVVTSMGLTPTGGIPSATRTGDLDPGVLLFLLRAGGLDAAAVEQMVNHAGGLGALSGGVSDMEELEKLAAGDGPEAGRARLAVDVFAEAVARTTAGYCVVLGGIDMLVLTGGIGEHSRMVREAVAQLLAPLRILGEGGQETASKLRVLGAQEEQEIARHVRRLEGDPE